MWKDILDGLYQVSDSGKVKRTKTRRVLKPAKSDRGYLFVTPSVNNRKYTIYLHRVVAEMFIGPCPTGYEVNHKDGDKNNNSWGNLEYLTRSQNIQHAYDTGLAEGKRGSESTLAKLTERDVRKIRRLYNKEGKKPSYRSIGRKYGVSYKAIQHIVMGHTWQHI